MFRPAKFFAQSRIHVSSRNLLRIRFTVMSRSVSKIAIKIIIYNLPLIGGYHWKDPKTQRDKSAREIIHARTHTQVHTHVRTLPFEFRNPCHKEVLLRSEAATEQNLISEYITNVRVSTLIKYRRLISDMPRTFIARSRIYISSREICDTFLIVVTSSGIANSLFHPKYSA